MALHLSASPLISPSVIPSVSRLVGPSVCKQLFKTYFLPQFSSEFLKKKFECSLNKSPGLDRRNFENFDF